MGSLLFGTGLFELLFLIVFVLILGTFLFNFVRGLQRWNRNNHSPRLTVEAKVVSRRSDVSYHHHNQGTTGAHMSSRTTYYITFEVASGDRMEFAVPGTEYGMLVEGDRGQLSFQGTRYLGFQRM